MDRCSSGKDLPGQAFLSTSQGKTPSPKLHEQRPNPLTNWLKDLMYALYMGWVRGVPTVKESKSKKRSALRPKIRRGTAPGRAKVIDVGANGNHVARQHFDLRHVKNPEPASSVWARQFHYVSLVMQNWALSTGQAASTGKESTTREALPSCLGSVKKGRHQQTHIPALI